MAELYHQVSQENATKKALDKMKRKLKAFEDNAKVFSDTIVSMLKKLKMLEAYLGFDDFKSDTIALLS